MSVPVEITFHNLPYSENVADLIRERADKFRDVADEVSGCRVWLDRPHLHSRKGSHYRVRVQVRTRNGDVVIDRDPPADPAHADPYLAIRDAFEAAVRRIRDLNACRRDRVRRSVCW